MGLSPDDFADPAPGFGTRMRRWWLIRAHDRAVDAALGGGPRSWE
jgi:hypothetical protein